jgi:hypothetical protein
MGTISSVTVGSGPTSIPNFMSLGGYTFSLTSIAPGAYSSADCGALRRGGPDMLALEQRNEFFERL